MNLLKIENVDEQLVVDSRLIAADLQIQHKNFLATIDKNLSEIEEAFGAVAFKTREFKTKQGNTSTERYAFLTEDQAHYVMTLSRNTEKVRRCKRNLVKAFSEAKQALITLSTQNQSLVQEMKKLEMELELAKTNERLAASQTKLLATVQLLETVSPGLAPLALGKADAVVERVEYVERVIDKSQDRVTEGVGIGYLTKKYGFKNNKQTWAWLKSVGYGKESGKWEKQLAAITTPKLPKGCLAELSRLFKRGNRQMLLGE